MAFHARGRKLALYFDRDVPFSSAGRGTKTKRLSLTAKCQGYEAHLTMATPVMAVAFDLARDLARSRNISGTRHATVNVSSIGYPRQDPRSR